MHVADTEEPATTSQTPESQVLHNLMTIGRLLRQRFANDTLDPSTFFLLRHLLSSGPVRLTDLACAASLDASTVSRHAAQMQRNGLIQRSPDPDDGRAHRVAVSEAGRAEYEHALRQRRDLFMRSLEGWDDKDVAQLAHLLSRLVGNIEDITSDTENA